MSKRMGCLFGVMAGLATAASAATVHHDRFHATSAELAWGNQRGNWVVVNGEYAAASPSNAPLTASLLPWHAGDFEFAVDLIDPVDGGLWVRADADAQRGVVLVVKSNQMYWHVISSPSSGPWTVHAPVAVSFPSGRARIRVVGSGALLRAYIDDAALPATTLDLGSVSVPPGSNYLGGRVGFYDYSASGTRFDNVRFAFEPVPEAAAGWWRGEQDADDAIGSADGALVGAVAFAAGKAGTGFRFPDNGNHHVAIADGTTTDLPAQFALEAWVRPRAGLANPGNAWGVFSKVGPPWVGGISYQLALSPAAPDDASATAQFRADADPWPANPLAGGLVDVGIWSHLLWRYDGSQSRLHVDGREVSSVAAAGVLAANVATPLYLNCDGDGAVCAPLDLDEAVLYHRAPSAAEVQARHEALAHAEVALPYRQDLAGTLDAAWGVRNRQAPTPQFQPDGALRLWTTPTDLYGASNNLANLPLLRLPDGEDAWALTAAFRFDAPPSAQWQQAGVLVLDRRDGVPDPDNYLRLGYVYEPVPRFEAVYDLGGTPNADLPNGPLLDVPAATPYWLRLRRHGGSFVLGYSLDGERFDDFRSLDLPLLPRYAGVFALHGPSAAPALPFDLLNLDVSADCLAEPDGLLAHWRGADITDSAGGLTLTAMNGAGHALARIGKGFQFDGNDDHFARTAIASLPVGAAARTVLLWAKTPRDLVNATESALFQYGSESDSHMFGLITSGNAPGRLYFYGHNADLAGSTVLRPDTWYHLGVSYDGSNVSVYVDGVAEASAARVLDTVPSAEGLNIGRRWPATRWQGLIDDVQVYARALDAAEIAAIHRAGGAGLCPRAIFANGFEDGAISP